MVKRNPRQVDILENDSITVFSGRNINTMYREMLVYLWSKGKEVAPRGKPTKELFPAVTIFKRPQERFCTVPGRGANPFFQVAEILWILAGRGDVEWISHYSKSLTQFADSGFKNFSGAYGNRIRDWGIDRSGVYVNKPVDQLRAVYDALRADPDSRQAVMSLWHPLLDNYRETNDRPCNNVSYFKIRDNKLHLHQVLRSNDLTWGLSGANVYQWGTIHELVAGWLGLKMGELLFFQDSLHAYTQDYNAAINKRMLDDDRFYDVYESYVRQEEQISYEETEENLKLIFDLENNYRFGQLQRHEGEKKIVGVMFRDMLQMLKIYNIGKQCTKLFAVEECSKLIEKDCRIAALEYLYRTCKDEVEKKMVKENIEENMVLNDADKNFILDVRK